MILLIGPESLPAFRREHISRNLSSSLNAPVSFSARDLYLVDIDQLPAGRDGNRLLRLLGAVVFDGQDDSRRLIIAPRPGTQTPWSSKATDILARCGLGQVRRIERAMLVELNGISRAALGERERGFLHDRMTQAVVEGPDALAAWFTQRPPEPLVRVQLSAAPMVALAEANTGLGLALSEAEMAYLAEVYAGLGRDPTDAELMMFAQVNSEHCRHKIFNAGWTVDGRIREGSLFDLIRHTHAQHPDGVISAYDDNAAVMEGFPGRLLTTRMDRPDWREEPALIHIQIKVETHNHPTAISPDPGAATGSGGEIRDESATGRGGRPVAGLTGFTVSDLRIPDFEQPWERNPPPPERLADARRIMLEGPIGAARFNNEFGRPALGGYFRTFCRQAYGRLWGYHKPIMIAGGAGMIIDGQTRKLPLEAGHHVIVLGGPSMLIGLGGGAASSMAAGRSSEELDYASVQRGNPEMQRRCQEVIDRCWVLGADNPIASIHDVGAGGLANAIPELLHDGGAGGNLELREIPTADPGLSPMALWCNEAQERYVLAVARENLETFAAICRRERCPWAVLGEATADGHLRLDDKLTGQPVVDLALETILGRTPRLHRDVQSVENETLCDGLAGINLADAIKRVVRMPSVGSKQFLITIGDRTVGGLSVRDPMVGPYQVPVGDCAVTLADYRNYAGTAMAMGERTPLAVHNAPASGRVAVAEALLNLSGTVTRGIERVKLSANWMAAAGASGQDAALRDTVEAVAGEFCPALGLAIPVGKDSLSMQTVWRDSEREWNMIAPVSLIVTAFAPVPDVRMNVTPQLLTDSGDTVLVLIDLGRGRLGGSALAQAFDLDLGPVPDVDDPAALRALFETVQKLVADGIIVSCHDRSDGGLFATLLEMALAGHCGLDIDLTGPADVLVQLFNEEPGVVLQVRATDYEAVRARLDGAGLGDLSRIVARPARHDRLNVRLDGREVFAGSMARLNRDWAETSYRMQRLRDHPECADEEFSALDDWNRPGLTAHIGFELRRPPAINAGARPKVAILREQGVNGQRELAVAFMRAGFDAVDVHMSDLETGEADLESFQGIAAGGGFSFGDVLGAGQGWARSILFNDAMRDRFEGFFRRPDRFALGVCNGCQMLAALKEIIPGADDWPRFVHNRSRQFEARLSLVGIEESPSLFFRGMEGSRLPVATAHGEGRADFTGLNPAAARVAVRYVDGCGRPAERYPENPNGSAGAITGVCNSDGRVTILMPHPERLLRAINYSWAPAEWDGISPWMRMFENAREWCDNC